MPASVRPGVAENGRQMHTHVPDIAHFGARSARICRPSSDWRSASHSPSACSPCSAPCSPAICKRPGVSRGRGYACGEDCWVQKIAPPSLFRADYRPVRNDALGIAPRRAPRMACSTIVRSGSERCWLPYAVGAPTCVWYMLLGCAMRLALKHAPQPEVVSHSSRRSESGNTNTTC